MIQQLSDFFKTKEYFFKTYLTMNIKYEIHSIKNSNGKGEERHYAHLHEGTAMNADQLESHIEESCSLTKSDMEATLSALRAAMIRELSQGKRFHLPSIGSFSLSVDLNLPEGKPIEKMRGDYISVRNLNFRPDTSMLREIKNNARFERADVSTKSNHYTEEYILKRMKEFFTTHAYITRRDIESLFGFRRSYATKWLKHFRECGVLKQSGPVNSAVYLPC